MSNNSQSFTVTSKKGRLNVLKTHGFVSRAFDPKTTKPPFPSSQKVTYLWDTGATNTVISSNCASLIGLKPIGKTKVYHANGSTIENVHLVNIFLPNGILIPLVRVTEARLSGTDILIGMDIISQGDFAVTNQNGGTKFSFRIPSSTTIDFVEEHKKSVAIKSVKAKTPAVAKKVQGRNEKCNCGSGKKYKYCHGK